MSPSRIFMGLCLCFAGGVAISKWIAGDIQIIGVIIILLVISSVLLIKNKVAQVTAGGIAVLFLGIFYASRLGENSLLLPSWLGEISRPLILLRDKLELLSGRLLAEPHASILNGILLGAKGNLPYDVKETFRITGIMHITAVSGYNVTVVAVLFQSLTRPLPRQLGFWAAVVGIIGFVVITGASASVVRAGIMGILTLVARQIGRRRAAVNCLVFAATLMVISKPSIVVDDIGFQLSVAATYGLIALTPIVEIWLKRIHLQRWLPKLIHEALATTLAAQIMVIPLLVAYFGNLSLVSPLANMLIVPLVPLAMSVGFIAIAAGWIWLAIGRIVGYAAWLFLAPISWLAEKFSIIPYASVALPSWFSWLIIPYYLVIFYLIFKFSKQRRELAAQ